MKKTCSICGKRYDPASYMNTKNGRCFTCEFWFEKIQWAEENPGRSVRIGGKHYIAASDLQTGSIRGFGGRGFVIKFHDGRIVQTANLWHNGDIPKYLQSYLPDNAVFLTGDEWKQNNDGTSFLERKELTS
jgi:hypothetical protein